MPPLGVVPASSVLKGGKAKEKEVGMQVKTLRRRKVLALVDNITVLSKLSCTKKS
jgi:hypothetical protein